MNRWITPWMRILSVFVIGIVMFFVQNPIGFLVIGLVVLLMVSACGGFRTGIKCFIVVILFLTIEIILSTYVNSSLSLVIATVFYVLSRFALIGLLGALVTATMTVSELIAGLRSLHLPEFIVLPVSVMLRFFPSIRKEFGFIRESMRIRGIDTDFRSMMSHPMQTIEYIFVPLLMRSCKIADELTMSATVRGIERKWRQ